ncbi:MAG: hypothetical protein ABSA13_17380, partial [Beijerinckiaceae bacterium]
MAIAVHRYLQAAMTGEGLNGHSVSVPKVVESGESFVIQEKSLDSEGLFDVDRGKSFSLRPYS